MTFRSGQREDHTASYFSHDNVEATKLRDQLANDSLEMLIQWLHSGGNVGIHGKSKTPDSSFHRLDRVYIRCHE